MATQILAPGITALASTTFTLAAGESVTLTLKGADGTNKVRGLTSLLLQKQKSNAEWQEFDTLGSAEPVQVLQAVGTFRLYRNACDTAVGADRD